MLLFPTVAWRLYGSIRSVVQSSGTTVTLPSGAVAGDLFIVFTACRGATAVTFGGSWVSLYSTTAGATPTRGACNYLIASGGETSVTPSSLGTSPAHNAYLITGQVGVPQAATPVTAASAPNPDPPSLTPSWGTAYTLWLAAAAIANPRNLSAYPTNYSNGQNNINGVIGTSGSECATAQRFLAASSENPGAFTCDGTPDTVAGTVAVKLG